MDQILRFYLPVYFILYFSAVFVLPTYRTWKQTGINPITFGKEDNAHNYIGKVMKILIGFLLISTILFSIGNQAYEWLTPIHFLQNQTLIITGLIIIHLALIWIFIAQYQMSTNWRIGIDEKNKTNLVSNGVFSISRNPIFLGMILTVWGMFFIIPNALTFFTALATYFIIHIQIRLEEEFLEKQHGQRYKDYKFKVRRLV